ncbi:6-phospho-beta-glucosidase [Fictibacillus sp. S7]|uniref:6-phospho-beta-glucosidase n=1 Tax=Fictibacillus sp. S7 TaxID=2212476 RepID=UPI0010121D05|nr:6-phospho-beta-glucosidase [Fictibacillus sp. S7]RXY98940.1 6-phospho-beta-glucosidase [Fictibacillus sp. S7]
MKLTILGGAGMRTPLLIEGLFKQNDLHFKEVTLFDVDEERLSVMGGISRFLVDKYQGDFILSFTTDIKEAVRGADFIFSAIRVGQEEGRVLDEQIALKYGVLGQETTGPGGFAMGLRTIPVMLEYSRIIYEEAPEAWLLNFTNPAGLMAQALTTYGKHKKVIGICDAHAGIKNSLCKFLKVPHTDLQVTYFGLNHLGWVPSVYEKGVDRLPEILDRYEHLSRISHTFRFFEPELIRNMGMLPNEYLYYFYYADQAVTNILQSNQTRGEQIVQLNRPLLERVSDLVQQDRMEEAWADYKGTLDARGSTYMSRETTGQIHDVHEEEDTVELSFEEEGYEGLALNIIRSIANNKQQILTLNVPNNGTITQLHNDDVVEVPCLVNKNGYFPINIGDVPDFALSLIHPVKTYERLAVECAVKGDYQAGVNALTVHPLVPSFTSAKAMMDDYLTAHQKHLPQFRDKNINV